MAFSKRSYSVGVGAVLAVSMIYAGWTASAGMRRAADAQSAAVENMRTWRSAYEALIPVQARWNEIFQLGVSSSQQDLVDIARSLRLPEAGLYFSDKGLQSDSVESVAFEGVQLGLTKTCVMGEGTSDGVIVAADSMTNLIRGLERTIRKDLSFSMLETQVVEGIPGAILGGLCVMVRSASE